MAYNLHEINDNYVQFYRMHQYECDILYKFFDVRPSSHPTYGDGYRAYVVDHKGARTFVQIPGKYLRRLVLPDAIEQYLNDISIGQPPFLVYRGTLPNGSFNIDILPYSAARQQKFLTHMKEFKASVPTKRNAIESNSSGKRVCVTANASNFHGNEEPSGSRSLPTVEDDSNKIPKLFQSSTLEGASYHHHDDGSFRSFAKTTRSDVLYTEDAGSNLSDSEDENRNIGKVNKSSTHEGKALKADACFVRKSSVKGHTSHEFQEKE